MPQPNDRPDPRDSGADSSAPLDPRAANEVLIDVTGGDAAAPNDPAPTTPAPATPAPNNEATEPEVDDPDQYHLRDQEQSEQRVEHERREQDRPATNAEELPEDGQEVETSGTTAERLQGHGSDPSPSADVSDSGLRSSVERTPVERTPLRREPS